MVDNQQASPKDKLRSILEAGALEVSRAGEAPRNGWKASWLLRKSLAALGMAVNLILTTPAAAMNVTLPADMSYAQHWTEIADMPVHVFSSSEEYEKLRANLKEKPELYRFLGAISEQINSAIDSDEGGAFSILDTATKSFAEDGNQVCIVYMNLERSFKDVLREALLGGLPAAIIEADGSVPEWLAELAFDTALAGEPLDHLELSPQAAKAVAAVAKFAQVFILAHEVAHCRMMKDVPTGQLAVDSYHEAGPDLVAALYATKEALARGESIENVARWLRGMGELREAYNHDHGTNVLSAAYFESGAVLKGFSKVLAESGLAEVERMISLGSIRAGVDAFSKMAQIPQASLGAPAFDMLTASLTPRLRQLLAREAPREMPRKSPPMELR